ncbi:hypothetical protein [Trichormus variabilis]|uniref:Uncharacterized protein n=1 Tax=Trichormus variabilis SAG 1403-4b TaxID=447716 RepID=A0A433UIY1_ANAVA|nr:hypothetical protein [Trichormus variabilis]MBD2628829.1 hypothetical protein [Trichormus variabilis FACHB-164]RUS93764.1 hypothetical protein DSM107003_42650 [Trichormus variabilis SAG 1403-4b]
MTIFQSIKPFDEQYLLVSKRSITASNLAVASLANYVSLITGKPVGEIIVGVGVESRRLAEKFTQEEVDSHIQTILDSYITS